MHRRRSKGLIGICVTYPRHELIQARILRFGFNDVDFVLFGPNDIRYEEGTVSGYWADKDAVRGAVRWIKGIYPMPDAVFLDGRVELDTIRNMERAAGKKVFNSFTFDKLQGDALLRQDEVLSRHLPDACIVRAGGGPNPELGRFLLRHRKAYLKPANGCSGKGILRVELDGKGQVVLRGFKRDEAFCINRPDMQMWTAELKPDEAYIAQQAVDTVTWHSLPTDIRLNMSKNGEGQWEPSFLTARAALSGGYVRLHHYRMLLRSHFAELFLPIQRSAEEIESEILEVGYRICSLFDRSDYHMGDLGIDLGIDTEGKPWIFEVNPLPYPYHMAFGDHSLIRPLEYARFLALRPSSK